MELAVHQKLCLLTVLIGVHIKLAYGFEVKVFPPDPHINQTVILNVTGITDRILFSEWYVGEENSANNQIIRYNSDGSRNNGTKYFKEADIYPNGSLSIQNVQKAFEGNYTVFIQEIKASGQQTVFLKVSEAPASGIEIEVIPPIPTVGDTVLLNVTSITERILYSEWYLGNTTLAGNQIIRYNNGNSTQNHGPNFFDKASIYNNGSLMIKDVQKAFEGNYTVVVQGESTSYQQTVLLSISMVSGNEINVLVTPSVNLKEHDNVFLNVTGIAEEILFSEWYQGNKIDAENQIIRYNRDGSKNPGAKYFNKTEIYPNASLAIKDFTKDLEGEYTVFVQGFANPYQKTVKLELSSPGLNVGAIVGIVIACIAAVAAIGVGIYCLKTKDSSPL